MAKVVDLTSDPEQAAALLEFYGTLTNAKEGDSFVAACTEAIRKNDFTPLTDKIVDDADTILAAPEKDAEGFFTAVWCLLKKISKDSAKKLVAAITKNSNDKSLLRLKILNNFYNMTAGNSTSQYELFEEIVKFAHASNNTAVLLPHFNQIDQIVQQLGLDTKQQQKLFKLIQNTFQDLKESQLAFDFLLKYLRTVKADGLSGDERKAFKHEAATAVIEALKLDTLYEFEDLAAMPAIQLLKGSDDTTQAKLYELLQLFVSEQLDAYNTFHQKNTDFLKTAGLDHEELLKKIRVLTLVSQASQTRQIPYAQVASSLQVAENDVESWVIAAVSSGALDAKLDQVNRLVVVSNFVQRVFPSSQWQHVSNNLTIWKDNVNALLQLIQAAKKLNQKQ
jgi:translation initiation factor 3 subunit M